MNPSLKKALAILILLISLFFIIVLIYMNYNFLSKGGAENLKQAIMTTVFTGGLCLLGIRQAIKLYKQGQVKQIPELMPLEPGETVKITVNISLNEYRSLLFKLTYSNVWTIYMTIIGFVSLLGILFYPKNEFHMGYLILFLVFLIPVLVYFQASRNFKTNKYLQETVNYVFNSDNIIVNGESFNSTTRWSSMQKVKETKDWFLIYNTNVTGYFIPKKAFQSSEQIEKVKAFIWKTEMLKKELK